MSICGVQLLAEQTIAPATQNTAAPVVSIESYAWWLGGCAAFLCVGLLLFFTLYGGPALRWSPVRASGRQAVVRLCVVAGVMVWCFIGVPVTSLAFLQRGTTRPVSDAANVSVYAATCAVGLLAAAVLHIAFRRGRTAEMLGLAPLRTTLSPSKAFVAAACAIPFTYLVATLSLLAYQSLGIEHESAHAMLQLMERNETQPWVLWITIANAVLLAPLFEELLFRGHLQTILTAAFPRSRMAAIVLTSIFWAVIHEPWTAPSIFALGIAIGIAYEWSGSLWVALAIHIAFNAFSTANFLESQR